MSLLRDLIDAYVIGEKVLRGLERNRLEALDAAFGDAIPALEAFDRAVASGNSSEINKQSEDVADRLGSIARELEESGLKPGPFPELAKKVKTANTWEEYFPAIQQEYRQLSPTIIDTVKRLHKQVQEKLAQRP